MKVPPETIGGHNLHKKLALSNMLSLNLSQLAKKKLRDNRKVAD